LPSGVVIGLTVAAHAVSIKKIIEILMFFIVTVTDEEIIADFTHFWIIYLIYHR